MADPRKPLVWLKGEIKSPPFSSAGRVEAGTLLARLQNREPLGMPHSRPMTAVGSGCHELRVRDGSHNWRIVYRVEPDGILILEVFAKKTRATPHEVIEACKRRLANYLKSASE